MTDQGGSAQAQDMQPVRAVDAGVLRIAYVESGPADGPVAILLHGYPYDIHSYVEVAPRLAAQGCRVIVPYVRGYGPTRFRDPSTPRSGQQAAVGADLIALMYALAIPRAVFAGYDWGGRAACVAAALWPERCQGLVSVNGYLIQDIARALEPAPAPRECAFWYQWYFQTERGRAGYDKYRREFSRLIWRLASPQWHFDEVTFERSAKAFDNPDHVSIVIHNYRWRLGLAEGETTYDGYEAQLSRAPVIGVPTITMEGDANGAPHPDPSTYAKMFSGKYSHRTITGGVGHNLPQEAPKAFAAAIMDVAGNV